MAMTAVNEKIMDLAMVVLALFFLTASYSFLITKFVKQYSLNLM